MVELRHAKEGIEEDVFNYAIAYGQNNREPLFYESYPGSIVDVSQLQHTLKKAKSYGYEYIGFILEREYFCKENFCFMDDNCMQSIRRSTAFTSIMMAGGSAYTAQEPGWFRKDILIR